MSKKRKIAKENEINISDLKFYYGIPHCHTALSTGRGNPIEALDYGKRNNLDFMIITDHNSYLGDTLRDKDGEISKWQFLLKSINRFNKRNDDFIALHGFETHSSPWGDLNIINSKSYFTGTVTNLNALILWLIQDNASFVCINHPGKSIDKLDNSPIISKFINCIELGNGSPPNKYSRYEKHYFHLLDKGFQLSAINSQDNHRMNFGESENLTCAICNRFDKASLINAFKNRHTFSTESKTLKLFFTINSTFMGGKVDTSESLDFYIYAEDSERKINKIQILSNNGRIIKEINEINLYRIKYIYKKDSSLDETWYIVKIFLSDKKIAITSPIFILNDDDDDE